ncbi:MAG: HupE/UreJ family protein [Minicystis sp.]
MGLSRGEYRLESGVLDAQVTFAHREVAGLVAGLDENGDGALSAAEVARSREAVSAALAGRIKVVGEGAPCAAELISAALADEDGLTVHARYRCPSAAPEVKVDLALLDDLPFGHRHLARLSGNSGPSDALLSRRDRRFTITASAPSSSSPSAAPPSPSSPLPAASSPFLAGVVRVFSRPDPSLLLLALAFGRREIRAIVFALLAFTAASIGGLVLAARGVWAPSSAVLGPALLIALAYVVVDDLLRASTTRPWSMALPFGLAQGAALALLPAAAIDLRAPSALTLFGLGAGLAEIALAALLIALVIARRQHRERGIAG